MVQLANDLIRTFKNRVPDLRNADKQTLNKLPLQLLSARFS